MASFVSQKGVKPIQAPNQVQSSMNPDEYMDAYIKSQMTAPDRPYQATDKKPVANLGTTIPDVANLASKGDWLTALGTGAGGILKAKAEMDADNQRYGKSSAGQFEQANAATDPYLRSAYLQQGQEAKASEAAQAAAYNELLKEQGKNALEGVKFKGQQGLERDKLKQQAEQEALNRSVQYSQQNLQRDIQKTNDIQSIAEKYNMPVETLAQLLKNPGQLANVKTKNPGLFAQLKSIVQGNKVTKLASLEPDTKVSSINR